MRVAPLLPLCLLVLACNAIVGIEDAQPACLLDGKLSPGERDVDCGGACPPCGVGLRCEQPEECISLLCLDSHVCGPYCGHGVVTFAEFRTYLKGGLGTAAYALPGRTCGVPGCMTCPVGTECTADAQCTSLRCDAGRCTASDAPGCQPCEIDADCPSTASNEGYADPTCLKAQGQMFGLCRVPGVCEDIDSCGGGSGAGICDCGCPPLYSCADDAECLSQRCLPAEPGLSTSPECSLDWQTCANGC